MVCHFILHYKDITYLFFNCIISIFLFHCGYGSKPVRRVGILNMSTKTCGAETPVDDYFSSFRIYLLANTADDIGDLWIVFVLLIKRIL